METLRSQVKACARYVSDRLDLRPEWGIVTGTGQRPGRGAAGRGIPAVPGPAPLPPGHQPQPPGAAVLGTPGRQARPGVPGAGPPLRRLHPGPGKHAGASPGGPGGEKPHPHQRRRGPEPPVPGRGPHGHRRPHQPAGGKPPGGGKRGGLGAPFPGSQPGL